MDSPHDNVGKLRHAYKSWHDTRGADARPWLDLMADDVKTGAVSDGAPEMAFTKSRCGKAGAAKYFSELHADWEMIHFTPEEFVAQGDRVVVLSKVAFRFRKTGKVAESPKADFFRFRDGLIVELFEFFDTAGAFAVTHATPTKGEAESSRA